MSSYADLFRSLPTEERLKRLRALTDRERTALLYAWEFWARTEQLPPAGEWTYWVCQAGRGWGKTRTGAEWVRRKVQTTQFVSLIAPTAGDVRDVMVEGPSGILACCPPDERPLYEPSNRRLEWPNGARSSLFSADEPDRLRGPSHGAIWADELAAWRYPDAWDQAMFGLRLGDLPQACITTTPKPVPFFKEILKDPGTVVSRGSTSENVRNLSPVFLTKVVGKYVGTRLGRQELDAELLEDNPGALWKRGVLDALRVSKTPALSRVVVAIDPMGSNDSESAECGIVVAGLGDDGHGYVLEDVSLHGKPHEWGGASVTAYNVNQADRIVAETNFGGDMVEHVIRTVDENASFKAVTASRGKKVRAEPVAALYEQGRIHHVGFFAKLEDELCDWDPATSKVSPNRLDALVWAFTELMLAETHDGLLQFLRGAADRAEEERQAPPPAQEPSGVRIRTWRGGREVN